MKGMESSYSAAKESPLDAVLRRMEDGAIVWIILSKSWKRPDGRISRQLVSGLFIRRGGVHP